MYEDAIEKSMVGIESGLRKRSIDDEVITQLYRILYQSLWREIHEELSKVKSVENEKRIRALIRAYVLGGYDPWTRKEYVGALKPIQLRILKLKDNKETNVELKKRYLELYDDFMSLAAFRSFKYFALYIEKHYTENVDRDSNGGDDFIIEHTLPIFEGWYYYATKMVLDGDVKFISKQMPTAYGKSYGDVLLLSFIFGYDINNDAIKVFGNPYNVDRCLESVMDIMCRREYAKVFPYYDQFNGEPSQIFEKANKNAGFKIRGSKKPVNFLCVGKDSKISGARARYIFLDDITQAEDMNSYLRHEKDINTYKNVWSKRTYGKNNKYIIAGGTAYSIYDLLSWLKKRFGFGYSKETKSFKYTKVAVSNEIIQGGLSVFIQVPKLDYETDESTYPEQFDTFSARKERSEDYETFMAMEQQTPLAPKNTPFYYTNLKEYESLPEEALGDKLFGCKATLDGKRKGADYCAMPICYEMDGEHFLIDALYDNRPMEELYDTIVAKIIQRGVTHLVVENNINVGLSILLQDMLQKQGYYSCKIEEVFNYEKKEDRILNNEVTIKTKIRVPRFGMYSPSHPLGKALRELYTYSYDKTPDHDDFTDALATYSKVFITKKAQSNGVKAVSFSR